MEQGCTGSETDSEDRLGLERRRRRERREERSPISPARTTSTKREKGKRRPEREARGGREGSPSFFFPPSIPPPPSPSSTSFGGQSAPFCRSNLPAQFGTAEEGEEWRKEGRKEGGNSRVLLLFVFRSPSNSLLPANERASSPIPHIPPTLVLLTTPLSKWHSLSDPEGKTLK